VALSQSVSLQTPKQLLSKSHAGIPIGKPFWKMSAAGTVYNFDTMDVDGKPEVGLICLKIMVGPSG
jgi:hypothetical protein